MTGTFSSVNNALSALRYHQVVMDVGQRQHRQRLDRGLRPAPRHRRGDRVPRPSPRCGAGTRAPATASGSATSQRMVDPFLDARARREHGNQAYLDTRQAVLDAGRGRHRRARRRTASPPRWPTSARGWHDLANNPRLRGRPAARCWPGPARWPTRSPSSDATSTAEEGDQRARAASRTSTRSTPSPPTSPRPTAASPSRRMNGTDAGVLLDQRDALALRLSELTGAIGDGERQGRPRHAASAASPWSPAVTPDGSRSRRRRADGTADGARSRSPSRPPGGTAADVTAAVGGAAGGSRRRCSPPRLPGLPRRASTPSPSSSRRASTTAHGPASTRTATPGGRCSPSTPPTPAARWSSR